MKFLENSKLESLGTALCFETGDSRIQCKWVLLGFFFFCAISRVQTFLAHCRRLCGELDWRECRKWLHGGFLSTWHADFECRPGIFVLFCQIGKLLMQNDWDRQATFEVLKPWMWSRHPGSLSAADDVRLACDVHHVSLLQPQTCSATFFLGTDQLAVSGLS